ncbi:hypothetical protein R5R35_006902 [Gryllus longicercus]|uniref:Uncharacterized protein n=1 Tax=Gryllus longicercus TaxID=2509291 RepID=A0AAN9VMS7_9ORTH
MRLVVLGRIVFFILHVEKQGRNFAMLSRWPFVLSIVALACLWPPWECRAWRGKTNTGATSSRAQRPPPSAAAAAVGVRGYRRFHANDSLVGRAVPCSRDEKLCLRRNLLFHPPSGKCLGLVGPASAPCDVAVDGAQLESGSGHVVGTCLPSRRGDCVGFRMAFDGKCYREELVRDVICGCQDPPVPHPLAGFECRCAPHRPAPRVVQPQQDGRCLFPDLHAPYAHDHALTAVYPVAGAYPLRCSNSHCYVAPDRPRAECSGAQRRCFEKGMVWVAARNRCFRLLEPGPCERNYILVLSKNETLGNIAFCRHIRGDCPPGKIHMAFDQRCHDEREMKMIAPSDLQRNVFGDYMLPMLLEVMYAPVVYRNHCAIRIETNPIIMGRTSGLPKPPCGHNNIGDCVVEVYAEPPLPLDDL